MRHIAAVVASACLAVACSQQPKTFTITVFAASSLTEAFSALGKQFEATHDGVNVKFNFGASTMLATQILTGGGADVFASADQASMKRLAGLVEAPRTFARNRLAIVVEKGNPKRVKGLSDLDKHGLIVVLCATQAPCGKYSAQALAKAKTTVKVASREQDVKAVLTKVRLGDADAGIVYASDIIAGGYQVKGIPIPDSQNVTAPYPVAALADSRDPSDARAFVDLVASPAAHSTFKRYGFLPPR